MPDEVKPMVVNVSKAETIYKDKDGNIIPNPDLAEKGKGKGKKKEEAKDA